MNIGAVQGRDGEASVAMNIGAVQTIPDPAGGGGANRRRRFFMGAAAA